MAELIVALTLLGILLALLSVSLGSFRSFNHYQLTRQRCISAAQAQLDSLATTNRQIREDDFERLWPKMIVAIEKTPGTGQWQGLTLLKVKTQSKSYSRDVKIELSRYVSSELEPQK